MKDNGGRRIGKRMEEEEWGKKEEEGEGETGWERRKKGNEKDGRGNSGGRKGSRRRMEGRKTEEGEEEGVGWQGERRRKAMKGGGWIADVKVQLSD